MRALLVRHASIAASDRLGQRADEHLTGHGRDQAGALAAHLSAENLAAIFSSPLTRAMETAAFIAQPRRISVTPEPSLHEVEAGDWENRAFRDLAKLEAWRWYNTFRSGTRPPHGEMMLEVQARSVAFLERASRQYPGASICAVTHADVIRAVVCHYTGIPLDLSLRIRIATASLTILRIENDGAELQLLNWTSEKNPVNVPAEGN